MPDKDLELDILPIEILELHKQMGHIGTQGLYHWFNTRNIKCSWHKIKNAIQKCPQCPNVRSRLRHNYHGTIGNKLGFNRLVQIDFIGPLKNFKNYYVCTMVDVTTGLGHAKESKHPDQNTTILTLWSWISAYGTPDVIQSDQGTHFIGKKVQRTVKDLNIFWDFHQTYNPTASGAI